MTKLAWMSDIHLNFLGTVQIENWLNELQEQAYDALLITGDIGEANSLHDYLIRMADHLRLPIYFVLGNHDYYHGSIEGVRTGIHRLAAERELLRWLPLQGIVRLNEEAALIGHDGWGDGGYGNFMQSSVMLNDYLYIQELVNLKAVDRLLRLRALGQESALYLRRNLPKAFEEFRHVYVAVHPPPYQEAAWHMDKTPVDNDPFLPHFTCKAVGDVLLDITAAYPEKQVTVLCGHTHGTGKVSMRPNLHVLTAGAEYGHPRVEHVFEF
jgi:3',5'-cyclic-AMP phosphodiesterase